MLFHFRTIGSRIIVLSTASVLLTAGLLALVLRVQEGRIGSQAEDDLEELNTKALMSQVRSLYNAASLHEKKVNEQLRVALRYMNEKLAADGGLTVSGGTKAWTLLDPKGNVVRTVQAPTYGTNRWKMQPNNNPDVPTPYVDAVKKNVKRIGNNFSARERRRNHAACGYQRDRSEWQARHWNIYCAAKRRWNPQQNSGIRARR